MLNEEGIVTNEQIEKLIQSLEQQRAQAITTLNQAMGALWALQQVQSDDPAVSEGSVAAENE